MKQPDVMATHAPSVLYLGLVHVKCNNLALQGNMTEKFTFEPIKTSFFQAQYIK